MLKKTLFISSLAALSLFSTPSMSTVIENGYDEDAEIAYQGTVGREGKFVFYNIVTIPRGKSGNIVLSADRREQVVKSLKDGLALDLQIFVRSAKNHDSLQGGWCSYTFSTPEEVDAFFEKMLKINKDGCKETQKHT